MAANISPSIRKSHGLTADELCFQPSQRKQLSSRCLMDREVSHDPTHTKSKSQDREDVFMLAASSKSFVDIQKKLQTLDFHVNTECDKCGDFLLHIAAREGVSQLPLLMSLVKVYGADIELCNAEGRTALMLAAGSGNHVMCDALICLFGANPNMHNPRSGQTALHIAMEGSYRKTVECLIRRGADVNQEDHNGMRPDDLPGLPSVDDCREMIQFNRAQRQEMLSDLVRNGDLVPSKLMTSDLYVIDKEGCTLIMVAAKHNSYQVLESMLAVSTSSINAQHCDTGMTALAMAAMMGNGDSINVLMRHGANPAIADMTGLLPLHHAVLKGHHHEVCALLDHFPKAYLGLHKAIQLCKRSPIHMRLKEAWEKRQNEIVIPEMLVCALNGDAEQLYLLLDEGDCINCASGAGNWPVYLAVENGHLEVLKLLYEKGGDICRRHPLTGATVLHTAAMQGHENILAYLLTFTENRHELQSMFHRKGSSISIGYQSMTSLFSSTFSLKSSSQKLLDINAVNYDRKTALQLAAERGLSRIVEMLLVQGSSTALLDSSGNLFSCPQYDGVCIMVESHRQAHTTEVIRCITEKTTKPVPLLQKTFQPRLDHNLRTQSGDTPLMVAAAQGRLAVLEFLLQSAVYSEVSESYMDSGQDSGTTEWVAGVPPGEHLSCCLPGGGDQKRCVRYDSQVFGSKDTGIGTGSSPLGAGSPLGGAESSLCGSCALGASQSSDVFYEMAQVRRVVTDANTPKGKAIFHDGLTSHVCAVNLTTGLTALHYVVKGGDWPAALGLLLEADPMPVNTQTDDTGETVLHMACRLHRRKCVALLLARADVDVNIRTLEGALPEELTSNKAILKLIHKHRNTASTAYENADLSLFETKESPSVNGSSVNFERVQQRYEALRIAKIGNVDCT